MKFCRAVLLVALGLLMAPLATQAQQPGKAPLIGVLMGGSDSASSTRVEAFRQGLRELGYAEGQNITFAYRYATEKYDRLPDLAAELIQLKVNLLVASGTPASLAAKRATGTIPIVLVEVADPVGSGLVPSLGRPAGNITGLSLLGTGIYGKQIQILKEAVPKLSRLALLWNPANPVQHTILKETQAAARAQGLTFLPLSAQSPNDFERAFAAAIKEHANGLIVTADVLFVNHRARIAELAAKHRLPAMYRYREFVTAGGFIAYGPHLLEMYRRAATYVDKILKGAKPADLPVEQPMRFEVVINMKTAKALGLTIPQSVLIRADQLIE